MNPIESHNHIERETDRRNNTWADPQNKQPSIPIHETTILETVI